MKNVKKKSLGHINGSIFLNVYIVALKKNTQPKSNLSINNTTHNRIDSFNDVMSSFKLGKMKLECTSCKKVLAEYYSTGAIFLGGNDETLCVECYKIKKLKE